MAKSVPCPLAILPKNWQSRQLTDSGHTEPCYFEKQAYGNHCRGLVLLDGPYSQGFRAAQMRMTFSCALAAPGGFGAGTGGGGNGTGWIFGRLGTFGGKPPGKPGKGLAGASGSFIPLTVSRLPFRSTTASTGWSVLISLSILMKSTVLFGTDLPPSSRRMSRDFRPALAAADSAFTSFSTMPWSFGRSS